MPRHLHFTGLPPGASTWYEKGPLRKQTTIQPGDRIPLSEFEWPMHYVNLGMAVLAGEDDGQDLRMVTLEGSLRGLLTGLGFEIPGQRDPRLWTLRQMLDHVSGLLVAHEGPGTAYRQELAALDQAELDRRELEAAELEAREAVILARGENPYGMEAEGAPEQHARIRSGSPRESPGRLDLHARVRLGCADGTLPDTVAQGLRHR